MILYKTTKMSNKQPMMTPKKIVAGNPLEIP
jgi:nucleoid-associated protein YgaU